MTVRQGGCVCGAVRFRARGAPSRTTVCHCTFCQRVTGSAFAIWPTYPAASVEIEGRLSTYEHRSDVSARWIRVHFCPACGARVSTTFEKGPGEVALLGGTFDDTSWISVDRHVWVQSRQHWVDVPSGTVAFPRGSSG